MNQKDAQNDFNRDFTAQTKSSKMQVHLAFKRRKSNKNDDLLADSPRSTLRENLKMSIMDLGATNVLSPVDSHLIKV